MQVEKPYVDFKARAVQNYMVGNINTKMIPNQLRPIAVEMARNGERAFALVTMGQMIQEETRKRQPMQVYYVPPAFAFNSQAALPWKAF